MNGGSKVITLARTCVGECAWGLASMLVALLFVSAFVLLAEPVQAIELEAKLASPVNLLRLAVLTAAVWMWAYIARTIRGVGSSGRGERRAARRLHQDPAIGTQLPQS